MIINSRLYFGIQEFKQFLTSQGNLHPTDRMKNYVIVNQSLEYYSRRLKRAMHDWINTMPKNKKKFVWKGYVNITIAESATTELNTYMKDDKLVFQDMNQAILANYTIKIYYDTEKENYRASMTCYDEKDSNFGYMLGAFAGDWYTALVVLLFKHYRVAGESWQEHTQSETRNFG